MNLDPIIVDENLSNADPYRTPDVPESFFDEEIPYKEPSMLINIRRYILGPLIRLLWIPMIVVSPLVWMILVTPVVLLASLAGWVVKGDLDAYWYRESKYDAGDPWKLMEPYWALSLLKRLKLD